VAGPGEKLPSQSRRRLQFALVRHRVRSLRPHPGTRGRSAIRRMHIPCPVLVHLPVRVRAIDRHRRVLANWHELGSPSQGRLPRIAAGRPGRLKVRPVSLMLPFSTARIETVLSMKLPT
jgi:hypothetical protein